MARKPLKKRKPGRPELGPGLAKETELRVRVNDGELAKIDARAKASGQRRSKWVREILLREAGK